MDRFFHLVIRPQTVMFLAIVILYCKGVKGCQKNYGMSAFENTRVTTASMRQTLIPDINFSCNGTITKLLIGAKWQGSTPGFTQFQVWRKSSTYDPTYKKVGEVTIRVGNENSSELYEYKLETPLPFREGDIIGYFQPHYTHSELNLYLENTPGITTYYNSDQCVYPAPIGNTFSLESFSIDSKYPLLAVTTDQPIDQPSCECGFMSASRVIELLNASRNIGDHYSVTLLTSAQILKIETSTAPGLSIELSIEHDSGISVIISLGVLFLLITGITIVSLSVFIMMRRKYQENRKKTHPKFSQTGSQGTLDTNFIRENTLYAYAEDPTILTTVERNPAYNFKSFDQYYDEVQLDNGQSKELLSESLEYLNAAYIAHTEEEDYIDPLQNFS